MNLTESLVVAGVGCDFPGAQSADTLAGGLRRGAQSAGNFSRPPGLKESDLVDRALAVCVKQALPHSVDPGTRFAVIALGGLDAAGLSKRVGLAATPDPRELARPTMVDALTSARALLRDDIVDAVLLLGAVIRADTASAAVPFSIAFEKTASAPPPADGAAALVFARDNEGWPVHARLGPFAACAEPGARGAEHALSETLAAANWPVDTVGLLGVTGRKSNAIAEATSIARLFRDGPRETALYSLSATVGDAGAAGALGSLVAAVLCLDRAMLPCVPGWTAVGPALLSESKGLFVASESRFWFTREGCPERRAALLVDNLDSRLAAVTLAIDRPRTPIARTASSQGAPLLFPLAGTDRSDLELKLAALAQDHGRDPDLARLSHQAMEAAIRSSAAPLGLSIVAATRAELEREIGFMHRALSKSAQTLKPIRTPNGSVFTPAPVGGGKSKIAFVYPGNGTAYPGLGRDILLSFAQGVAIVEERLGRRLSHLLRNDLTFPKKLDRAGETDLAELAAKLNADSPSLLLVGIAFGVAHSYILRDCLGVKPHMALGYSVGELAMRIALGQTREWTALEDKLHAPCLVTGLSGPMTTVRRFWEAENTVPSGALWATHILKAPADEVAAQAEGLPHVYVMAINAPDETAIAGLPASCDRLVARVGAPSLRVDLNVAIHAPPARLERQALYDLCDSPMEPVPGIDFYSAATLAPVAQTRAAVADATATMLQAPIDFPALVDACYADGARVFIETGVRNNCTNWVGACLGTRPHVAVAMDMKGMPSDVAWMRAVAVLFANRVPLDFGELCGVEAVPTRLMTLMNDG